MAPKSARLTTPKLNDDGSCYFCFQAINRVPKSTNPKVSKHGRCGACKQAIRPVGLKREKRQSSVPKLKRKTPKPVVILTDEQQTAKNAEEERNIQAMFDMVREYGKTHPILPRPRTRRNAIGWSEDQHMETGNGYG